MDSMRSLNTSLPGASSSKQQAGDPPEQLLQAFKDAALSVTKLYKTAAVDQGRARSEGYQDALDELLAFLDKEDIGLSDGEGWRIRRWATERLDGRDSVSQNTESDDEAGERMETRSPPESRRSQSATRQPPTAGATRAVSPTQSEPLIQPPITNPAASDSTNSMGPQETFTFRSSYAYPQDAEITLSDLDLSDNSRAQSHDGSHNSITLTRAARSNIRHNHATRLNPRSANSLSRQPGQKRKLNVAEFFDISSAGHGRDGSGGGKRGRFV